MAWFRSFSFRALDLSRSLTSRTFQSQRRVLILTGAVGASGTISRDQKFVAFKRFHSEFSRVKLNVTPSQALIDEEVTITASGLPQGQPVTLQAYLSEGGKLYGSCAHYVADEDGKVDTTSHCSHGGTFTGTEPMGLFWSMKTTPGVKRGRLLKADMMTPYDTSIVLHAEFKDFTDLQWSHDSSALAQTQLYRSYTAEGVQRISVEENGLHGTLFLPPGNGPFPAVMDLAGLSPGIKEHRSAVTASRGIASFTLAYVAHKDLPNRTEEFDLHYFLRAFDWLADHPATKPDSMGIFANCIGAGFGLFIASKRPNVKCLISINGLNYPAGPIQTVEGEEIIPFHSHSMDRVIPLGDNTVSFLDVFPTDGDTPVIQGWRHGAPMLFIAGEDDQCINPDHLTKMRDQLPAGTNAQFVTYPGAGHLLDPPHAPLCGKSWNDVFGFYLVWGGSPKLHADAQEDAWARSLDFLYKHLMRRKAKL